MEYILGSILKCVPYFELRPDGITESVFEVMLGPVNEKNQIVILYFREPAVPGRLRVLETKESISIDFPIAYFDRLYPLLQDAINNRKYDVKFFLYQTQQIEVWFLRWEFIAVGYVESGRDPI